MNKLLSLLIAGGMGMLAGSGIAAPHLEVSRETNPTLKASLVPQATAIGRGRILVSWQRPLAKGGYSFEMALRNTAGKWSEVRTVAEGANLSMFSADLPAIAKLTDRRLLAYWEVTDKRDGDRYATTIETAISDDEGRTWKRTPRVYRDALAGQHSFLSWFAAQDGIGLLWLDANERSKMRQAAMTRHEHDASSDLGSVGLRYAALDSDGIVAHEQLVNPITCECCPTSAAVSTLGPLVVYRGRKEPPGTLPSEVHDDRPTVRDIYISRLEQGHWTKPHLVHPDNWVINACPDNGPAIDAAIDKVVVAWWTRAGDQPKVQVAFSSDSGDSFGKPIRIDSGKGEGQVTVTLLPKSRAAIVGWLENGKTWARYVNSSGSISQPVALGDSPHHSRLPHWLALDERDLMAVWTSGTHEAPHVEVSRIRLD